MGKGDHKPIEVETKLQLSKTRVNVFYNTIYILQSIHSNINNKISQIICQKFSLVNFKQFFCKFSHFQFKNINCTY